MIYGYCRVSTAKQNLERQVINITAFGVTKIYKEKFTGTTADRKEFKKLLNIVSKGDTIIFDSVSRMSRNAEDGIKLYFELYEKGVNLVFLKERHIDTDVYSTQDSEELKVGGDDISFFTGIGNTIMRHIAIRQIKLAFEQSEKEVKDNSVRTKEGLKVAKANGKRVGRQIGDTVISTKQKESLDNIRKMDKSFNGNMKSNEVMEILGLSRNTYFKYKKVIKLELVSNEK